MFFIINCLVQLFGLDLESLWLTAHQKRCQALLSAGKHEDGLKSHKTMMDAIDETTKASCLDWSNDFVAKCTALCFDDGDAALAASNYDMAIDLYSVVIDLTSPSDAIFSNRSKAKLGKRLWTDALLDAQKVIQLNPSSHVGYKLKHAAFHGAQRYDEAIAAFQMMLSKLANAPDTETRKLRQQYLSPSEVDRAIRKVIDAQLDNAPPRVLDTTTGLLSDREAQIRAFRTSIEYKELVSSTITHPDLQMKRIKEVVAMFFRYAMLSHRWEGKEPLLQDVQGKVVYELDPVGGITKLQSFCKTARDAGYRWAWSDTCCIDKSNNVELQESVNSMFIWYHHSALTVVYLSDVPPSSKSGALAKSAWNTRGWTVQEFLAPNIILFYQKDWTLYRDDRTPNHKDSIAIMQELEVATGIDRQAIVAFRPGMKDAREKLQWASTRVTTLQEDIAYSLSGVFGVRLRVDYGEKKQNALGRLLQEIVAQSGDITALDWVGESSEFNSCLPADITSYAAPPYTLPFLSESDIQTAVSSLRNNPVAVDLALRLYDQLDHTSAARFAHHRLYLPCIVFPVTEARLRPCRDRDIYMYAVKSDGLHDLQITTEDKFTPFSPARLPPAWQTILLVRPWSRHLLGLHDPVDDTQSVDNWSVSEYSLHDSLPAHTEPVYSDSHSRALRLIVRLRQPFGAFLLARQRDGEFKRIASDHDIIAQVKDMASINDMMDIRTLEIL
ncbi:heterokaryon incompatibility protein-domain-containing protein [Suillus lakei]|nr:heterokaryon incompatibility protein-domain-containing protein [Suillus lakei]